MKLSKILCPIDFSPGATQALRMAARMANEQNAELVIIHALHMPVSSYSLEGPFPASITQPLIDDAERGLDAAVREASAAGAKRVSRKLLTGIPWAIIVSELENQPYDLCVIGTHGRTGLIRILLGSVAEKVIRHAPCSVIAARLDATNGPFAHAMVPTDFSDSAEYAMEVATELVQPQGTISLVHVIEVPVAYSGEVMIADLASALARRATSALERSATKLRANSSQQVATGSRSGSPGAQTLAAIDEDPTIDLVVMGTHGRTGLRRVVMGSVAEKVARNARCPVLVARRRA
ncbi:MAG: universal stress protein [Kofleriaceae bacterium]